MADDEEKTQAPSAHKIQKAREEGNVSKSPEFVGFFVLLVGLGLMFYLFGCREVKKSFCMLMI